MKSYKHYLLVTLALIVLGGTGCTNHIEEQVVESNRNKNNMALNCRFAKIPFPYIKFLCCLFFHIKKIKL